MLFPFVSLWYLAKRLLKPSLKFFELNDIGLSIRAIADLTLKTDFYIAANYIIANRKQYICYYMGRLLIFTEWSVFARVACTQGVRCIFVCTVMLLQKYDVTPS
uniref:Uncharacterized protein n=1 Tax=Hyaloperonospora arabidopsidis (strain Emoy2) TaxID=559515 RepID=M4BFY5_HYAAE